MAKTTEIAPNIYRISIYAQWGNLQFNRFLVKDDEPLLFHTGLRGMHLEIREAVSKLINISDLRHISFSHFESDECGALNEWLGVAPEADVICSQVGALTTFHQAGDIEPITSDDVVGRSYEAMKSYQAGILAEYVPYTPLTAENLKKLADLKPTTLAIMHGSSFTGDCARALDDLNAVYREVFGREKQAGASR